MTTQVWPHRKTCDKCKHFTQYEKPSFLGACGLITDYNDYGYDPNEVIATNRAYAWDYEGYKAGAHVGIKFGCIHWEKKT